MKNFTYLSVAFLVVTATIALSTIPEKTIEAKTEFGKNNCSSRFARSSSCDGCHSGSGTTGPIIIIYTDGKKGPYSIPIDEGKTEIVLVTEPDNTISIDQINTNLASHNIGVHGVDNPIENIKPEFYDIHGFYSEEILKNIQAISIESTVKQSIEIRKPSINTVNILQTSHQSISMMVDMNEEKETLVNIFDINGKLRQEENLVLKKGLNQVDVLISQELTAGFYMLELANNEGKICKKIMVQ